MIAEKIKALREARGWSQAELSRRLGMLTFSCRITPNGSMKAVDLINTLNQQYNLNLPAEKADIERLDLYKYDAFGNKLPMLGKDMVVLGQA